MTTVPEPISFNLKRTKTDIFSAFMRARKEFGGATVAIVDGDERELTYTEIARAAFALGSAIRAKTARNEVLGIMLPTGAGAVIAFLAVLAAGRIPAMLNFTAGSANLRAAMRAAEVSKIITANKFIELGSLEPLVESLSEDAEFIYLEDIRENLSLADKVKGAVGPLFPSLVFQGPDHKKTGVILFTSGTEGEPKGVVLSHQNIVANVEQVRAHIGLSPETDSVFNPLPTFHCFGLTVGALLPLIAGVRAVRPFCWRPTPSSHNMPAQVKKVT